MVSAPPTLASHTVVLAGDPDWRDHLTAAFEDAGATLHTASTVDETLARCQSREVDCLVAGPTVDGDDAPTLVGRIRDQTATLPVVVCAADGSGALASDVLGAGATDYVALDDGTTPSSAPVRERVATAIAESGRESDPDRARQFDALFDDAQTATWVLDQSGRLQRANQTARDLLGDAEASTGEPFWTLPWWRSAQIRSDVEQLVTRAVEDGVTDRLVTRTAGDAERTVELTVHPVRHTAGDVVSVVVEGDDVTDEVSVHRELRDSERLHRVTLNNMTDTVLVTDESGAFTYVCPNVHFIFGYSTEEIRDLGSIDALLGADLFDRDRLAEEGVLTNIETEATDKAGTTHTLLVNVREVDIQDGSILFSCRDITKRKRREAALRTLHQTTRALLYAETKREIAHRVVDDTGKMLAADAAALYLFDTDANSLEPVAYTDAMAALHGPIQALPADEDSPQGYSFIHDETRFYEDFYASERLDNPATELRSAVVVPLDDHGVFVVGTDDPDQLGEIQRELVALVAATAEAALDRVRRESRLRSQERTLQTQNQQLTRLNQINELIRDIDRALVQAESRDDVYQPVCEALAAGEDFAFAWVGEVEPTTESVQPTAWAGADGGYLDSVDLSVDETTSEPAGRTAATRDVTVVSNVAEGLRDDDWQKEALTRGFQSVVSVPLVYDGFLHGVLTVYADAPDVFETLAEEVLAELGETVASAISALNRKDALITSTGTRLEFTTRDSNFTLLRLAQRADSPLTFEGGLKQTADGVAMFVTVDDVESVVSVAEEMVAVDTVRVLNEGEGLLQLHLSQSFIALSLADHGAVLRRMDADTDSATLAVDAPSTIDSRPIIQHVTDTYPETELVAKYTDDRTPTHELYSTLLERFTERQLEVVQVAYYSGFFESPREQSGEDIAAALDISPTAFYRHTRTVQRKLFATLFDDIGLPTTTT